MYFRLKAFTSFSEARALRAQATVRLDFHSEKKLATIFDALLPEVQRPTVTRSRVTLEKDGTSLVLKVEATDTVALRAALNAYLRWISSLKNVLTLVENIS
jgi:tRNA threonylcarbamoyladenosine modification (KEOPS) complex  Pcc1 subunit